MQLVEQHIIKPSHPLSEECITLSILAKQLYNRANYIIRQKFINEGEYLNYYAVNRLMIDNKEPDYYAIPGKVSNGILRLLDKNWISFFKAIKSYNKDKSKFNGRPKLPGYKNEYFIVPYEKGAISKPKLINQSIIKLSKTNINIKSSIKYNDLQAARIVPKSGRFVIEVIYNKEPNQPKKDNDNILGLDLGLDNFISAASNISTFIINGRAIKSINQYYNKKLAKLKSILPEKQYKSKRINKLTNKRNDKINHFLHNAANEVISYCLTHDISKIVLGYNKKWKNGINIGKRNNQNFVSIPFYKFKSILNYKAELNGLELIETEESYTSKCSFFDKEEVKKHKDYKGRRIKRGLFKTSTGKLVNADINGALNIIKKAFPLFKPNYGIEDIAVRPLSINISC